MALNFPNKARNYDASHHRVRFWGHDDSREVAFLLEGDALHATGPDASNDEDALLSAFDAARTRIEQAARKAYSRRGNGFYVLAASDI